MSRVRFQSNAHRSKQSAAKLNQNNNNDDDHDDNKNRPNASPLDENGNNIEPRGNNQVTFSNNNDDDNDDENYQTEDDIPSARHPSVLEPSGRSALELYGEKMRQRELYLSFVAKTWPKWRKSVSRFVRFNSFFEWSVFGLIVLNALVIILDSIVQATNDPTDNLKTLSNWVNGLDQLVTWAFMLEMVLKWIGMGLWTNGSGYFASFGNCVDFFVNAFSIWAVIQELVDPVGLGAAASAVRSVRLLRTFRAVKALRHLSVLVDALFVALGRLADVGMLYGIFITFMCFIGLQLFRHSYGKNCVAVVNSTDLINIFNDTIPVDVVHTSLNYANQTVYWQSTQQICARGTPLAVAEVIAAAPPGTNVPFHEPFEDVNYLFNGYVCPYGQFCKSGLPTPERNLINFDSIFFAMESLITVSVFENWDVIMYDAMYARGQAAAWYFLVVAMIGSIFTLNLVLAILTDAFTQSLSILRKTLEDEILRENQQAEREREAAAAGEGGGAESNDGNSKRRLRSNSSRSDTTMTDAERLLADNSDDDAGNELGEISRSRYKRFNENNPWEAKELERSGSGATSTKKRSYSVLKELRTKVHDTDLALDHTNSSSQQHAKIMTDEDIDTSLDWLRAEWAVVVLEAKKREDLELTAAEMLHDSEFKNQSAIVQKIYGIYRRIQSWTLQNTVATRWFMYSGFILTVINVIVLSIIYPKMPQGVRDGLNGVSITLSMLFVLESVLRFVALGIKTLIRDPFNIIDAVLALVSVIELAVSGSTAISAVRTIRLLRLMSYFPSVINALRTLAVALKAASSLMLQLFIMMFVMAVLGQQLFRGKLCGLDVDPPFLTTETRLCNLPDRSPAFNFDSLASSLVTVFVVVAGDGWRQYWIDCSSRTSPYHSVFFIFTYVMGNYLFVNLFVAVLIDAANQSRAASEEEQKELADQDPASDEALQDLGDGKKKEELDGSSNGNDLEAPLAALPKDDDASAADDQQQNLLKSESSVQRDATVKDCEDIMGKDDTANHSNPIIRIFYWPANALHDAHSKYVSYNFRVLCAKCASNQIWKGLLFLLMVLNSASYFFWAKATDHPYSYKAQTLNIIELLMFIISFIDSIVRYLALGRVCSPVTQVANIFSFFTIIFQWSSVPSRSVVIAILRVVTRAIRPWSYLMRYARVRLIFFSLVRAIRALRSVGAIALLIWFTYGVLGAQLFSGKLYACTEGPQVADWGDQTYSNRKITTEAECIRQNFSWAPYKYNYDNVGKGMLCLVTAATTDDWSNTMYLTTGVFEEGQSPVPGHRLITALFMCSFCAMMSFFLINVIVSVIVDAFFTTKKQMEDNAAQLSDQKKREIALAKIAEGGAPTNRRIDLQCGGELDVLGEAQQDYFDLVHHALLLVKPTMAVAFGPESWRWKVRSFIRSRYFNYIYLFFVILDFCIQATDFTSVRPISGWVLLNLDLVFSLFLLALTIVRIVGNSLRGFVQDFANVFEFTINFTIFISCFVSVIIFASTAASTEEDDQVDGIAITQEFATFVQTTGAGLVFGILRNLRMLRFQRILNTFHGVRVIIFTIRNSVNNFLAGISVVFHVYFFYACLGLALFGRVIYNDTGLTPNNNFNTIPLGISTLFRVGTLDDWEAVMRATGIDVFPCDKHLGNCGHIEISVIFFYSFIALGQWVTMSSFVAILLNSFAMADRRERFAVQKKDVDRFRKLWKMFADPRTQLMSVQKVPLMLQRLGSAFAVEDEKYLTQQALDAVWREQHRKNAAAGGGASSPTLSAMDSSSANHIPSKSIFKVDPQVLQAIIAENERKEEERNNQQGFASPLAKNNNSSTNSPNFNNEPSPQIKRDPGVLTPKDRPLSPLANSGEHTPLNPDSAASPTAASSSSPQSPDFSPQNDDVDDSTAGNDFDAAPLLKMAINRTSLKTRFVSLKQAQQYFKELKLEARDSSTFHGVVTQGQVFKACMQHHYGVPLPANFEFDIEKAYEKVFPRGSDDDRNDDEEMRNGAGGSGTHRDSNDLAPSASSHLSPRTPRTARNGAGGAMMFDDVTSAPGFRYPSGKTDEEGNQVMQKSKVNPKSANDLLSIIRLQQWWRSMRFQRVVQAALKKKREEEELERSKPYVEAVKEQEENVKNKTEAVVDENDKEDL